MSTPSTIALIEEAIDAGGGRVRVREIQTRTKMNVTTIKKCLRHHPARFARDARNPRVVFWGRRGR